MIAWLLLHLRLHLAPLPPHPCFVASFVFLLSATLHILPRPKYARQCDWNVNFPLVCQHNCQLQAKWENRGDGTRSKNHGSYCDLFCWRLLVSPRRCEEVSPKPVSRACLVCGAGKSPLRRNHRTRILISGTDSICSGLLAAHRAINLFGSFINSCCLFLTLSNQFLCLSLSHQCRCKHILSKSMNASRCQ